MDFTLHQLRIFLQVAHYQSITKASESLHLTQPAVSIQMKKLQDQFDIPITEVIGRKLYLTDFGKELAEAAKRIMEEVEGVGHLAHAYRGNLSGKLKISVVSTGKYVMPYFLSEFTHRHEGVKLVMDVTNRKFVIHSLEQNEPDFALVSVLPDQLSVEREELMDNELFLISNPSLVPDTEALEPEIMNRFPLIFREPGSATRQAMEGYIERMGISNSRLLELTSNEAVKQAVMAGLGISIMPLIGIRRELEKGTLKVIPVAGFPIVTTWNLIWLKGKQHSPASTAFLDYIRQEKQVIINKYFRDTVSPDR